MLQLRSDTGAPVSSDVLRHSHQRVVRISVLDSLWNPVPGSVLTGTDGYAISGSVAQQAAGDIRRRLWLSVANPGGLWTPDGPGSLFYWDRYLRVERGVRVADTDFLAPLGVFLIDTPAVTDNVLSITGADRMDRALRSEFTDPVSYPIGSGVGATVKDILVEAGVGDDRWTIDDGGATLGAARHFEVGDTRLSAARALATNFGLEVFADASGYMVVQPKPDPNALTVAWTFAAGAEATHLGVSKRWSRDRFYNHIRVAGESADQVPIMAEAEDTNPASPTRVDGPMGRRLYKHTSAMITTEAQAQAVADAQLFERALIEESIDLPHVANPLLEVHDLVRIVDQRSRTNDSYLISALNTPLAESGGSLDVQKVRRLS